jgi:pimeloyl-ACP methyl ester carboxylesterase
MPTARYPLRQRCFYSGTEQHPLYVDRIAPETPRPGALPVIMVHGAGHTGACFLGTPDGRPGWGDAFAAEGHTVFVPDWPGHGRSPMNRDFARLSMRDVAASLLTLVEEVGPAVLVVHSAAGPMAWWMTEKQPNLVAAIVGLAPGPPANLLPAFPDGPGSGAERGKAEERGHPICVPETEPVWVTAEAVATYWANSARFPYEAMKQYGRSIVPESARVFNERFNVGGRGLRIDDPGALRECPILIVTGDQDPRHPRVLDASTAEYLGAEFVWLPDLGISGNGHMLMMEDNSEEIATLALTWLGAKGF